MYTNNSYILPNLSKLKKSDVIKIFWFKVEGWYFQTPTENMVSVDQPMKAQLIEQSLNEFIVMSYYLLPPLNHHQQADLFSFRNYNGRLWLGYQFDTLLDCLFVLYF